MLRCLLREPSTKSTYRLPATLPHMFSQNLSFAATNACRRHDDHSSTMLSKWSSQSARSIGSVNHKSDSQLRASLSPQHFHQQQLPSNVWGVTSSMSVGDWVCSCGRLNPRSHRLCLARACSKQRSLDSVSLGRWRCIAPKNMSHLMHQPQRVSRPALYHIPSAKNDKTTVGSVATRPNAFESMTSLSTNRKEHNDICNASNSADRRTCWLCGASFSRAPGSLGDSVTLQTTESAPSESVQRITNVVLDHKIQQRDTWRCGRCRSRSGGRYLEPINWRRATCPRCYGFRSVWGR